MGSGTNITDIDAATLKSYYEKAGKQTASAADIARVLEIINDRDSEEDLTVAEIEGSIAVLGRAILANANEIENLNRLIGLLLFELAEQGIEPEHKELINELEIYGTKI